MLFPLSQSSQYCAQHDIIVQEESFITTTQECQKYDTETHLQKKLDLFQQILNDQINFLKSQSHPASIQNVILDFQFQIQSCSFDSLLEYRHKISNQTNDTSCKQFKKPKKKERSTTQIWYEFIKKHFKSHSVMKKCYHLFKQSEMSIPQLKNIFQTRPDFVRMCLDNQEQIKNKIQKENQKSILLDTTQIFFKALQNPKRFVGWDTKKIKQIIDFSDLIESIGDWQKTGNKIENQVRNRVASIESQFTQNAKRSNNIAHLWLGIFKKESQLNKLINKKNIDILNELLTSEHLSSILKSKFIDNDGLLKCILRNEKNYHGMHIKHLIDTYPQIRDAIMNRRAIKTWKLSK